MSRRLKDRLRRMDPEMRDILLRNGISLWVQSGHWLDIADLLTSIDFVQARADDGSIEGLVADYNSALEAWPQDGCGSPGERLAADRRHSSTYTGTGAAVSHATVTDHAELIRTGAAITSWATFVGTHMRFLSKRHAPVFQLAWNSADSGPVAEAAKHYVEAVRPRGCWLGRLSRGKYSDSPVLSRVLAVDEWSMEEVVISDDGNWGLTGGSSGTLYFWDTRRGGLVQAARAHSGWVSGLAAAADWSIAISLSRKEGAALVWDPMSRKCLGRLRGRAGGITAITLSADGLRAATVHNSGRVGIWDMASRKEVAHTRVCRASSAALSGDGAILAVGTYGHGACPIHAYDTSTCTRIFTLDQHDAEVGRMAISRDGRTLVAASSDGTASLWDLTTRGLRGVIRLKQGLSHRVAMSADGKYLVVSGSEGDLWVWDLPQGRTAYYLPGHMIGEPGVAVDATASKIISAGLHGELRIWDLSVARPPADRRAFVQLAAALPDLGRVVVVGDDRRVQAGTPDSMRYLKSDTHGIQAVSPFAFTPDLGLGISGHDDGSVSIWDLRQLTLLAASASKGGPVDTVRCIPGRAMAVSHSAVGRYLALWNLLGKGAVRSYTLESTVSKCLAITPDGRYCLLLYDGAHIAVLDMEDGRSWQWSVHTAPVGGLVVSPSDGLVSSYDADGRVYIWKALSGDHVAGFKVHLHGQFASCFTRDGAKALIADGRVMRVIDARSGRHEGDLRGHDDAVYDVAVSPDGQFAVSSSTDGTVRLWDISRTTCVATHCGNEGVTHIGQIAWPMLMGESGDGRLAFLRVENEPRHGAPAVVATRFWEYGETGAPGRWSDTLEVVCFWCGRRVAVAGRHLGRTIACPWDECKHKLRVASATYDNSQLGCESARASSPQ